MFVTVYCEKLYMRKQIMVLFCNICLRRFSGAYLPRRSHTSDLISFTILYSLDCIFAVIRHQGVVFIALLLQYQVVNRK